MTNTPQSHSITRKHFLRRGGVGLLALTIGLGRSFAANKQVKVGFILPDYEEARYKNADQKYFEEEARKLNIIALIQVSNNSEQLQASQVENLLTQGVDVLVVTPVNAGAGKALVQKAAAANVPFIDYNFLIPGAEYAAYVGRDAVEIGERIAEAAVKAKPKGNYVLVFGDEGMSVAVDTAKGNLNVLGPLVKSGDITIVSQQYHKAWSTESARAQVENALTKVANDLSAVVCSNDGMAYGAIQALQAQGLGGKVFVTGVDCEPKAQLLIKDGLLSVSNFSAFDLMGRRAADAALALATHADIKADGTINNGAKDIPWIKAPNINVTKENLAQVATASPWWFDKAKLGI